MYNVIITKMAFTRSTLSAQNSMSFGGQAPPGPAKELKRSPRFLSRGWEKMLK